MSANQLPEVSSWGGALLLSDLGVILAEGPDTATFLHGQFSQDMNGQKSQEARLAAYCSAKGRMLASLVTLRPDADTFWLLADQGLLPNLVKRLSMFVLRAKAKLSIAADMAVVGLLGAPAVAALGSEAPGADWQAAVFADGLLIKLPDVLGTQRWMWVGPRANSAQVTGTLPQLPADQWRWLDVLSGIPRIETATTEQFVPQMINFELIGGVNFKKGCYPGQEVVARSQYRGTTKRRAFVLHAEQALQAGEEVFSATDPGQPAGMVVNAAPRPGTGGFSALAELKLSALGSALQTKDGQPLTLGDMPYEIPQADEAA